jgi:hypothetical protein
MHLRMETRKPFGPRKPGEIPHVCIHPRAEAPPYGARLIVGKSDPFDQNPESGHERLTRSVPACASTRPNSLSRL